MVTARTIPLRRRQGQPTPQQGRAHLLFVARRQRSRLHFRCSARWQLKSRTWRLQRKGSCFRLQSLRTGRSLLLWRQRGDKVTPIAASVDQERCNCVRRTEAACQEGIRGQRHSKWQASVMQSMPAAVASRADLLVVHGGVRAYVAWIGLQGIGTPVR